MTESDGASVALPAPKSERFAELGALGVLAGLVLEVVLALIFRAHNKSPWEEWGPLLADVLIAGGVAIEIFFGRKASDESAERVSAANERAAAAELAAEKLRGLYAWRRLSPDSAKQLSASLRKSWESLGENRMKHLLITYFEGDPETSNFAHEIGAVFAKSDWTVKYEAASYTGRISHGLLMPDVLYSDNELVRIARAAIASAGIEFKENKPPKPFMVNPESGGLLAQWAVRIYVGPKSMPDFD